MAITFICFRKVATYYLPSPTYNVADLLLSNGPALSCLEFTTYLPDATSRLQSTLTVYQRRLDSTDSKLHFNYTRNSYANTCWNQDAKAPCILL
jgi:hypothetical protein